MGYEFILIILLGIVVGILTGLLPALPVFTGPFLLYYFYDTMPLEHLLTFWLVVVSGSQFFGSVATITTHIPGEESSLVYIEDLKSLGHKVKNALLHSTALGSLVAGIISTLFLWMCISYVNISDMPWLNGMKFQIAIYSLALASFFFIEKKFVWTIGMIALGLLIGPKQNYALPAAWFDIEYVIQGYTFYMLALGTLIIPDIMLSNHSKVNSIDDKFVAIKSRTYSVFQGIKSSIIGMIAGLIPGPSASLASVAAYKTAGKDVDKKIIAAETANNSSVITCAIPLLVLAIPINQNALIMANILDIKSITIFEAILEQSFISGLRVIDIVCIALSMTLFIFYYLSTHLIDWYSKLIVILHYKMKTVLISVVAALIAVDLYSNEITLGVYLAMLAGFTGLGILLKINKVSPLPFLFAAILGDKLIWLYLQFYRLYF